MKAPFIHCSANLPKLYFNFTKSFFNDMSDLEQVQKLFFLNFEASGTGTAYPSRTLEFTPEF